VADTVKVTICDGWAVFHDGEQHGGGSVVDIPTDLAEQWQQLGWAKAADKPTPSKPDFRQLVGIRSLIADVRPGQPLASRREAQIV
jgi:hypothetical protein